MNTTFSSQSHYDQQYQTHLKLKWLQPKTIEAYSRAISRTSPISSNTTARLQKWRKTRHLN